MNLNFLTNRDKNVEQKMRYFSDYFLFVNDFIGRLPELPFDTPQSLVSKIIFQIENNLERSPRFIENHFNQLNHFFEGFLVKEIPSYSKVQTGYASYNRCPKREKKRANWLKVHPEFLEDLKQLETDLEKMVFQKIFLWLTNYMRCKHKLNYHKKDIEFCTHILICLFRLNGHSKEAIDKYIERILSSNKHKFPFPIHIYEFNKSEEFNQVTEEFLANHDFQKQFEGLKNLMINPNYRKGYFIYVIDHIKMEEELIKEFKTSFGSAVFISPQHVQLRKLKKDIKVYEREHGHGKAYATFFGKNKLLGYVHLNYEDKDMTAKKGMEIVKLELKQLSLYLKVHLRLTQESYLFTENFEAGGWRSNVSFAHQFPWVNSFAYNNVRSNPFEQLKNSSSPAKFQILRNEPVFINAMAEDQVSLFWQYIENLFWFRNEDNNKIRARFIQMVMKDLALVQNDLLFGIGELFYRADFASAHSEIGLTEEELKLCSTQLAHKHNAKFPLRKFQTKIKHSFMKSLINHYFEIRSKKYNEKWKDHFASLILELQEFRNAELHSGNVNPYSKTKLTQLLPLIMNRVRWYVIDNCKENENLTFGVLMDIISKE